MVGVLPRGKYSRAAPAKRLVGLEGIDLGLSELLFCPSTLPDPLPSDHGLPRVRGLGQALAAMLPGSPQGVGVGMAGDSRHVLVPNDNQGVICRMHLGRGVVDAGQGEHVARKLCHEHHHGSVRGEPLGARLFPDDRPHLRRVTGGRGCALEVDVGPHISEDLGGQDLGSSNQRLLLFLRAIRHQARPMCRARASGVGKRSSWGSEVWCGVVWCGVVWYAEGAVTKRPWPGCLPTGTGKREGCVCSTRTARKCVVYGRKRGSRGNLDVIPLVTVVIRGAPAVLPLSPPAGAGAALTTPTPSCCLGQGGLSATWHAPWRGVPDSNGLLDHVTYELRP